MPPDELQYHLSPHVYCCASSDGAIILDARNGKYLGIDAQFMASLNAWVADWPASTTVRAPSGSIDAKQSEQLIADLCKRGIVTTTASAVPRANVTPAQTSLSAVGCSSLRKRVSIQDCAIFLTALLWVLLMHRKHSLEPTLNWIQRHQNSINHATRLDANDLINALSSFERLRIWFYTANKHCLLDSLVLSVYLSLARHPCKFVIAVTTKPFLAHAWVQFDDAVLNDTVERVQIFRPLLIVG